MATDDKPSWNVLMLIGTIAGIAFGALFVLLFRERRQQQQLSGGGGNPINIYNVSGSNPQALLPSGDPMSTRQLTNEMSLSGGISLRTKVDTVTLSPARSARVFTVPRQGPMWRVRLYVIGPAGGYGLFSIDDPVSDDVAASGAPQGIVIPAGGHTEIRLGPRQIIYGRAAGTEDNVQVSVSASAEIV
jgi:hypothetical protein